MKINDVRVSPREREVLELISLAYTMPEVASTLYISVNTAITHKRRLIEKLRAKNTAGLVRRAFEQGFLTIPHARPHKYSFS